MIAGRFDDLRTGASWQFGPPRRIVTTSETGQVIAALAEVDRATRDGSWAYGFVSYEALPANRPLDKLGERGAENQGAEDRGVPLVWFAITEAPDTTPESVGSAKPYALTPWQWDWSQADHAERVERIHRVIAAGETYQTNLTTRLHARFTGDPQSWYADLATRQRGGFHALLDTGDHTIVSTSPECFLLWRGDRLEVVPMKGTAPRGRDSAEDEQRRQNLVNSAKERAENVMIVDLVRNDLSRLAVPGTVQVDQLLTTEQYDTVWQLTSSISAEVSADTTIPDVFSALFPCGSITGAPKLRTMELIAELEDSPRGIYCGAVGWIAPPQASIRARFGIAIRTAVITNTTSEVMYGVGGGITWDSDPAAEWAELHTKALVVTTTTTAEDDLVLIETMAVRDGQIPGLARHLARLRRSAGWFDIPVPTALLEAELHAALTGEDRVLRFALHHDGTLDRQERPLPAVTAGPVRLAIDTAPTADSVWRRHKTTRRQFCDAARRRHPEVDDVILVTEDGRVTETTIANLAVRLDGVWCTPPISDGLLPGIGREISLDQGQLVERTITIADLEQASEIAVISSVRGWRPAIVASWSDGLS